MKKEYIEATFIKEGKNRFISTILINGSLEECYVSSSSKLSKYIQIENHKVLVIKNKNPKLRTRYTLEASIIDNRCYYLNFNNTNNLYKEYLLSLAYEEEIIQQEVFVNKITKADFFIRNMGCIEVKSLLSEQQKIIFPDKSAKRFLTQLTKYISLLQDKVPVTYVFIDMSNNIKTIEWLHVKIKSDFIKALHLGLQINAFAMVFDKGVFKLIKNENLEKEIVRSLL